MELIAIVYYQEYQVAHYGYTDNYVKSCSLQCPSFNLSEKSLLGLRTVFKLLCTRGRISGRKEHCWKSQCSTLPLRCCCHSAIWNFFQDGCEGQIGNVMCKCPVTLSRAVQMWQLFSNPGWDWAHLTHGEFKESHHSNTWDWITKQLCKELITAVTA